MHVAIIGGTGDIGEGLALRLARDTTHTVIVGSRAETKAVGRADDYRDILGERGNDPSLLGMDNESAVEAGDVIVAAIPPEYIESTIESLAPVLTADKILVTPAVSMRRDSAGFHFDPPAAGSVSEAVEAVAPASVPVVGAFHNLAADALSNVDHELSADVLLTGDSPEAKAVVGYLVESIDGLRPLDAGPLANSAAVETVTPLLINLAIHNDGMHDLGVRFE